MLADATSLLNVVLGAGVLAGGIGYAVGQFFAQRRKGVADSLETALNEISAEKIKATRLADLAAEKSTELAEVRLANQALRNAMAGGSVVAPEIIMAIQEAMAQAKVIAHEEHEKTRAQIRKYMDGPVHG